MSLRASSFGSIVLGPLRLARRAMFGTPESRFDDIGLKGARGVIHVGANSGQERHDYRRRGLSVIWIEPIPAVFDKLKRNISHYADQRAYQYLLSDDDNAEYEMHVASNGGASSSIMDFTLAMGDVYPEILYEQILRLNSIRFDTFVRLEGVKLSSFDILVLDTQGAELPILRGASLDHFNFVKCEVGNALYYKGGATIAEVDEYMETRGFERRALKIAERHASGEWGDAWYGKRS